MQDIRRRLLPLPGTRRVVVSLPASRIYPAPRPGRGRSLTRGCAEQREEEEEEEEGGPGQGSAGTRRQHGSGETPGLEETAG